jgi:hypothetical protein
VLTDRRLKSLFISDALGCDLNNIAVS